MRKLKLIFAFVFCIFMLFSCAKSSSVSINFVENGGSIVEDIIIKSLDSNIVLPEPIRMGHTFNGWYMDEALTEPFIAVIITNKSITLYAKWTINQYSITFETNNGTNVDTITLDYDTDVFTPDNPEKEGHTFDGLYSD